MADLRAKMVVTNVVVSDDAKSENWSLSSGGNPNYEDSVLDEDNTYAEYTPNADLSMTVTNPVLLGTMKSGDVYYLDFSKVAL